MREWLVYAMAGVGCAAGVLVTVGVLLHVLGIAPWQSRWP